jgi:2-(3-amino-3-carboxypropyl)histidine synthase
MLELENLDYDLELDKVVEKINSKNIMNVLLQFPEGLKGIALNVKDYLEDNTKANILISGDPCFGACDIPYETNTFGIDLIVQFGHSQMNNLDFDVPIMFVNAHSKIDVLPIVKSAIQSLKKNVGLLTTIQHIHKLEDVKKFLTENGFNVFIGEGTGRVTHKGQVLGCNLQAATSILEDVDCYLFIGSGNFHAIGVALSTKKPVMIADPFQNEVRDIGDIKTKLLRQRHGAITKAENADSFGIIVGIKPGQARMNSAINLKKLIENHHKKAYIFLLNEINPEKFKGFSLDAPVSLACPRLAIDDFMRYNVPILTKPELSIVLKETEWDEYSFDSLA